jgi:hypothetical protein
MRCKTRSRQAGRTGISNAECRAEVRRNRDWRRTHWEIMFRRMAGDARHP